MESLDAVSSEIIVAIAAADSLDELEAIRIGELGKKGRISLMMRDLGGMDADARKVAGQTLNKAKDDISAAIDAPIRPATISPAKTGPNSRVTDSTTTVATVSSAEKRAKPVYDCNARTIPENSVVRPTTGSEK